jgi:hypothetical protein
VPRAVHTRLYINDEYLGLYLAVEQIDQTFVESRFGVNEEGNLYKVESGFLNYLGSDALPYSSSYELKTNLEAANWSDLLELTGVLSDFTTANWQSRLESILDVDSTLHSLALLNVFACLDSYFGSGRNYYVYHRSDTQQFTMLISDFNEAFGRFGESPTGSLGEQTILDPFYTQTSIDNSQNGVGTIGWLGGARSDETGNFASGEQVILTRMIATEAYNSTYLRALEQITRESFNPSSMNARTQELARVIREDVRNEQVNKGSGDISGNVTAEQAFENEISSLIAFVVERCAFLEARLNEFSQPTNLRLNDLMTANTKTVADDSGQYMPWIELLNMGPGNVSTAGFFLSDDSDVPDKLALPSSSLSDGEYLLLWVSELEAKGNAASFGFNQSGGTLFLNYQKGSEFELIDSARYPVLKPDISLSRYPDGDGSWYRIADYVTPGDSNKVPYGSVLVPANLVINELMADNDVSVESPYGTHPDWLELFNSGDDLVDLSGMYLTDNLADPKWDFPDGTVIEPRGYLLVWADFDSGRDSLHTNFNLFANGGVLALLASDGKTVIDFVIYDKQLRDVSYGRTPDGSPSWNYLTHPTAGGSNTSNSSAQHTVSWEFWLFASLAIAVCLVVIFKDKIPVGRRK